MLGAVAYGIAFNLPARARRIAFLLLIGLILVAEGLGHHIPRGYVYFAMGFSIFVEMLNIKARGHRATQ